MDTVTTIPKRDGLTAADLEAMPDDGNRYEIIDGRLYVTPAPSWPHQRAVTRLMRALDAACPAELEVLTAPFDVLLSDDTVVEPDIVLARRADFALRGLYGAPVLAVEVLSPGTRSRDLGAKRLLYERLGFSSYWAVDPERPSLTAWELRAGRFVEVADVVGDQTFAAATPFPVKVTPARLLD